MKRKCVEIYIACTPIIPKRMIDLNLALLISTVICTLSFLTFTGLSIWTFIKERTEKAKALKEQEHKEQEKQAKKKKKQYKDKATTHDAEPASNSDNMNKPSMLRVYVPLSILTLILTIVSGVFYWRTRMPPMSPDNLDQSTPSYTVDDGAYKDTSVNRLPSPDVTEPTLAISPHSRNHSASNNATRNAIQKMGKDYNKFESDLSPESNDGLDAIRLIEKYSRNSKNARNATSNAV